MENYNRNNRVKGIDQMRGLCIVYVMIYHLLFDIDEFLTPLAFFHTDWWEVIHIIVLAALFAVSGLSTSFSRDPLKAGVKLFFIGTAITMLSDIFTQGEYTIRFGVLTFLGVSMMIYCFLKPITDKFSPLPYSVITAIIFIILVSIFPIYIHSGITELYPLGIADSGFFSADYFPLLPYFFIFLFGTAFIKPVRDRKIPDFWYTADIKPVNFIGRHSLIFYLAHQAVFVPIILLIAYLITGRLPI
ncbi:MAG: DUF1624 domain-containing protein [Ruminococcus sp.]|jgi:uncharacterized membrane protein|nr:DUF1624 domain-containing protein [Ruminococcus sp.]